MIKKKKKKLNKIKIRIIVLRTNDEEKNRLYFIFARWHLISKVLHFSAELNETFGRVSAPEAPVCSFSLSFSPPDATLLRFPFLVFFPFVSLSFLPWDRRRHCSMFVLC